MNEGFETDPFKDIDIFKDNSEKTSQVDAHYLEEIFMKTNEGNREFTLRAYNRLIRSGFSPEVAMKHSLYENDEFFD